MHDDDVVLDPKLEPYMDALNRLKEEFGDEAFDEVFTIATEEDSIRVDALGVANDDMIMLFVGDPEDVLDDEYFELVNDAATKLGDVSIFGCGKKNTIADWFYLEDCSIKAAPSVDDFEATLDEFLREREGMFGRDEEF